MKRTKRTAKFFHLPESDIHQEVSVEAIVYTTSKMPKWKTEYLMSKAEEEIYRILNSNMWDQSTITNSLPVYNFN